MKNYLIAGLLLLVVALIAGVEPLQKLVSEATQKGTLRGVENCIDYSNTDLLSETAIKASCVKTYQKRVYNTDLATGRALPSMNGQTMRWSGYFENQTSDYVTTWVKFAVVVFDENGQAVEHVAETNIWLDPLGRAPFGVDLPDLKPEDLENIDFCELEDMAPSSCFSWNLLEIMGLSI